MRGCTGPGIGQHWVSPAVALWWLWCTLGDTGWLWVAALGDTLPLLLAVGYAGSHGVTLSEYRDTLRGYYWDTTG